MAKGFDPRKKTVAFSFTWYTENILRSNQMFSFGFRGHNTTKRKPIDRVARKRRMVDGDT